MEGRAVAEETKAAAEEEDDKEKGESKQHKNAQTARTPKKSHKEDRGKIKKECGRISVN